MKSIFKIFILIISLGITSIANAQKPEMILVEGGKYMMGSNSTLAANEKPAHEVMVNSFYMAKTECTFQEFDAFCKATGWRLPDDDYKWGRGNRPVLDVKWVDALMYCNWLSQQENLTQCYQIEFKGSTIKVECSFEANGYRLPTEAEWEYAARGGNKSKGFNASGSNNVDEIAWYNGNSNNKSQPVGLKKPNELGIHDLNGNVWEWCWDWYDEKYYSGSPKDNPKGPKSSKYRVLRGGSWNYLGSFCTVTQRYLLVPDHRSCFYGFRVVRTAVK